MRTRRRTEIVWYRRRYTAEEGGAAENTPAVERLPSDLVRDVLDSIRPSLERLEGDVPAATDAPPIEPPPRRALSRLRDLILPRRR